MGDERFELFERESEVLKKIGETYPRGSKESAAIQHAAFALAFALTEQFDKFAAFLRDCQRDLTDEEKENIRRLGLELE